MRHVRLFIYVQHLYFENGRRQLRQILNLVTSNISIMSRRYVVSLRSDVENVISATTRQEWTPNA